MTDIQRMNKQMLEIWENYLDLCMIFNDKLEEIHADDILNINLQLLKASITDLSINLSVFKNEMQKYNDTKQVQKVNDNDDEKSKTNNVEDNLMDTLVETLGDTLGKMSIENFTDLEKKNMLALFFSYLMHIDKDSILNNINNTNNQDTSSLSSLFHTSTTFSKPSNASNASNENMPNMINYDQKIYDDIELD